MKNKANQSDQQDVHDGQELGIKIFKALQENKIEGWIVLYPTNDEYRKVLEVGLAAKVKGLTESGIHEMIARRKVEAAGVYQSQFEEFLRQADSAGVNWQEAVFGKFDFVAIYPEEVKLKYLNGDIWFSCGEKKFVIQGVEALLVKPGYRLQSIRAISKVD